MLIQGKLLTYGDNLSEVLELRRKVFVEELAYSLEDTFDDKDELSMHVIVYEEDPNWKEKIVSNRKAVATGRVYFDGATCEIGNVAVLKDYRRKKYGDFTVRMLLNKAFISGVNKVFLTTPSNTLEFFETIGFKVINDSNIDRNLQQYTMVIHSNEVITQCGRKK